MAGLTVLHARLLVTIMLFFGALSIWGFFSYLRGHGISGSYKGALAIGELLMLTQFIIGLLLLIGGLQPYRPSIHILYGIVAIIGLEWWRLSCCPARSPTRAGATTAGSS